MGNTYVPIVVGGISAGALVSNAETLSQIAQLNHLDIPNQHNSADYPETPVNTTKVFVAHQIPLMPLR